jgi:hypothetical protein
MIPQLLISNPTLREQEMLDTEKTLVTKSLPADSSLTAGEGMGLVGGEAAVGGSEAAAVGGGTEWEWLLAILL